MPSTKRLSPDTPPPRRRTQAERTAETQKKLVRGAIALLKQKRYAGFRVAEAAEVAGVSRGAQSHHFHGKDALVLQALEAVLAETHQLALQRIAKTPPVAEQLFDALVEDSQAFFLGEDFYLALDLMMVGGDSELGIEVKRLARTYRISAEQAWVDAFEGVNYTRRAAEDLVWLTFSMARGLGVRKLMSGETAHFPRLFAEWKEFVLRKAEEGKGPRKGSRTEPAP